MFLVLIKQKQKKGGRGLTQIKFFNLVKDKSNSNTVKCWTFVLRRWDSFQLTSVQTHQTKTPGNQFFLYSHFTLLAPPAHNTHLDFYCFSRRCFNVLVPSAIWLRSCSPEVPWLDFSPSCSDLSLKESPQNSDILSLNILSRKETRSSYDLGIK